ncbi:hypothetical protein HO133_002039 [Letharia lupina]|uniref:Uncharacterized protein n=1 Tax=Letharia lupina TaxID=560253 RepID=A0A8H6CDE0_9LECA|nr:uncharacterized protein HO133_002039 [Letharia lupina]KAF6221184.1 hypothetical protein HO133_002039 [Letharia lupina]
MAFVIGLYEQQPVMNATCSVWFDISRTNLSRPFQLPAAEDVSKPIRAERKWFKNVRLFPNEISSLPLRADESGQYGRCANVERVFPIQPTKDGILENRVTHPSPYRAFESLPPFPRIDVSQEIAIRAMRAIGDTAE